MEELERKRAALEAKLAEVERALGRAMRDLQAARADPVKREVARDCHEQLLAERETVRAELEALQAKLTPSAEREMWRSPKMKAEPYGRKGAA